MQASLQRLRDRREQSGGEGGFTLIELLIVIVILGILAAIVVFAVQNLTGQSATAACQSEYKTLETAMEAYKAQVGNYPSDFSALTGTSATGIGTTGSVGPWLKDIVPENTTANANYWFTPDTSATAETTSGDILVHASGNTTVSTNANTECSAA